MGWMTCDETSLSTWFIEALICVPQPTTAGSEVRTAMAGNNSESSMEANTSQDGQKVTFYFVQMKIRPAGWNVRSRNPVRAAGTVAKEK